MILAIKQMKLKKLIIVVIGLVIIYMSGILVHLFEKDFYTEFQYPYNGDIEALVHKMRNNLTIDIKPINSYNFKFLKAIKNKCNDVSHVRLVYLVKSAPEHFDNRIAIRSTWGYENRFSDVEVRTVFLLGTVGSESLQLSIDKESKQFKDIVQANFTDSYFNNTYKTMMGFEWAVKFCSNSRYYMFVDDDYYVSTKNVLRFIRNPTNYPGYLKSHMSNIKNILNRRRPLQVLDFDLEEGVRLYAGYVFRSSPHRHATSKWQVSLSEYPYHMWPPYVTAGAYVLSREAIIDMFYASYYTQHFRFDDIYVGLLAYKTKIEPLHCDEFYFYKKTYYSKMYEYIIASHGYSDSEELLNVWTEQKSMGNA